jgi:hypothetical protein
MLETSRAAAAAAAAAHIQVTRAPTEPATAVRSGMAEGAEEDWCHCYRLNSSKTNNNPYRRLPYHPFRDSNTVDGFLNDSKTETFTIALSAFFDFLPYH